MATTNPRLSAWLAHRAGLKRSRTGSETRAFGGNSAFLPERSSFGKSEIRGLVGFVDLVGFSERVKGRPPTVIRDYLLPFHAGIIGAIGGLDALIDKTIGDEIMFVLPDLEEDGGSPLSRTLEGLLGGLCDRQRTLGAEYPLRLGLSYGTLGIGLILTAEYQEWTTFGEPVHLAKRLHGLDPLKQPTSLAGALGVLAREAESLSRFEPLLRDLMQGAPQMRCEVLPGLIEHLRGISSARCALIIPREDEAPLRARPA
jgi:class 3 adenylate cyclase